MAKLFNGGYDLGDRNIRWRIMALYINKKHTGKLFAILFWLIIIVFGGLLIANAYLLIKEEPYDMAQVNYTKPKEKQISIPDCEPVYLYEQVPVEKKVEVIKEVTDTACQDEYNKMKSDLQSLIYDACLKQNKYCQYLY